jgi:hypothetical protein
MDVWECDLQDVQSLAIYDMRRYIPSVVEVFSKFLHLVPVKKKSDPSVALAFRYIIHHNDSLRRPVWVHRIRARNF